MDKDMILQEKEAEVRHCNPCSYLVYSNTFIMDHLSWLSRCLRGIIFGKYICFSAKSDMRRSVALDCTLNIELEQADTVVSSNITTGNGELFQSAIEALVDIF